MTHSAKRTPCTQIGDHLELPPSLSFLPRRRALHFVHHLILPTSPPFSGGSETVAFVMCLSTRRRVLNGAYGMSLRLCMVHKTACI
ncbi:BZ3500_MvSof-1268-A1-R1_Chr7-2g09518 [Microbotryum saponariae]|uniref:BZ3500_MvSof-1268-A1-R1_Chr7-2g09518 protein n=1 Tax=Microbotryum saponariae TaxID=289078 RepID=A0A2X0LCV9_9BASI|nr:BZ3501_MvSof-1269-A2-R1_Chr7-1g09218 [Microbotryum saponariae]SDA02618.1 BZ3500_MvSof-1268-A1-R1_Chr7-2g09518 [Microbotryum saponariae]